MTRYILLLDLLLIEYLEAGPDSPTNVPGFSVLDVLKQRYPESSKVVQSTLCVVTLSHHCLIWISL